MRTNLDLGFVLVVVVLHTMNRNDLLSEEQYPYLLVRTM